MRRRRREQAVNLFAFQDIITGVAGVMLFILLLLVVQLSLRLATTAAASEEQPVATVSDPIIQAATANEPITDPYVELKTLQDELDRLRRGNQELLSAANRDLDQSIQNAQGELAEIVRQAEATKTQAEELQKQIASQAMSDQRKEILQRRDRFREELESLDREQRLHKSGKLVAFKTAANRSQPMWVVDLHDSHADLFDVQDPNKVTTVSFERKTLPIAIVQQIKAALEGKARSRSIILVLRPSVAGAGETFMSDFRESGFNIALELLDEDTLITRTGDVQIDEPGTGTEP